MAKMWAGRTDGQVEKIADDFNSSIRFDSRMYRRDIDLVTCVKKRISEGGTSTASVKQQIAYVREALQ